MRAFLLLLVLLGSSLRAQVPFREDGDGHRVLPWRTPVVWSAPVKTQIDSLLEIPNRPANIFLCVGGALSATGAVVVDSLWREYPPNACADTLAIGALAVLARALPFATPEEISQAQYNGWYALLMARPNFVLLGITDTLVPDTLTDSLGVVMVGVTPRFILVVATEQPENHGEAKPKKET